MNNSRCIMNFRANIGLIKKMGGKSTTCICCLQKQCYDIMGHLFICDICINKYHNTPNELNEENKKFIKILIDMFNYDTKIKSLTNILEISIYIKKIDIIANILYDKVEELSEKFCHDNYYEIWKLNKIY